MEEEGRQKLFAELEILGLLELSVWPRLVPQPMRHGIPVP